MLMHMHARVVIWLVGANAVGERWMLPAFEGTFFVILNSASRPRLRAYWRLGHQR